MASEVHKESSKPHDEVAEPHTSEPHTPELHRSDFFNRIDIMCDCVENFGHCVVSTFYR